MMAVDLYSRDSLLLPSQDFNEDNNHNTNILSANPNKPVNQTWSSGFSNSSDFGSAFSSPVESELGSTESDSEQEDDYIAELTRQMAHYMLQEDEDRYEKKVWNQEQIPKTEKFENLKKNEENLGYNNEERFLATSAEPNSINKPINSNLEFHSKQALIDYQIRAIQGQIMKQQQDYLCWSKQGDDYKKFELNKRKVKQFYQSRGRACNGFGNGQKVSWANNNHQQQTQRTGSEVTAVFLNEPGSISGSSCGTGVFLPRGISNTCESRKKPGCSTVLVPARVVQALKLQFDKLGIESRPNGATFPIELHQHEGSTEDVRLDLQIKKKTQSKALKNLEMGLPQEWTY